MDAATLRRALRAAKRVRAVHVALLVVGVYIAWIAVYIAAGHDVRDFTRIGTAFIARGDHHSREIRLDPGYRPPANQNPAAAGQGYDGQFSYYIAVDPANARYYLDNPSYRYSRILYPVLARAIVLGHRTAIPWALLVLNILAVGAGTWGLATWLRARRTSPLLAAIYGLWPGMFVAVQRDLTEPLSYGLVIAGLLLLDRRERWGRPAAALAMGFAGLARQTALVFPLVYGAWLLMASGASGSERLSHRANWRAALGFFALSFGPYVAYSIFVRLWLGSLSAAGELTPVPFGGILHPPYRASRQGIDLLFVVLPVFVALWTLVPRDSQPRERWLPWLLLIGNISLNVVFFAKFYMVTYTSASRQAIGTVLSALMCTPYVGDVGRSRRRWLEAATAVAMVMVPVVAVYGFTNVGT